MKNKMRKFVFGILIIIGIISGYIMDKPEESKVSDVAISQGEMRVHFLDVGQGDSIFIELPDQKTMLIDAGESKNADDIIGYIASLGIDTIDYVVATHPHSDHIGGMARVIYKMNVNNIYMPKVSHNTRTFENLLETVSSKNLTVKTAKAGVKIYSDDTINIEILSPIRESYEELNDYSAVIKLTYLNNSFLFMGDAEKLVEGDIENTNADIDCDVLKVGHHGSETSSSKSFIKKASPKYAVISCGIDNEYGHPHKQTLLTLADCEILRTDTDGTIIISSDGNEIKIK